MKRTGRKPMDRLNGYDSREAMWAVIRVLRRFTVRELYGETTLDISTVRDYVVGLERSGILAPLDGTPLAEDGATRYQLVKDVGVDAPRVRRDGTTVTQGQGRINLWRTMRIIKEFNARVLADAASTEDCVISVATAEDYIRHLHRAGYLKANGRGRYLFLYHMYTGPRPPMIQKVKRVWDQNLKKVMWSEDGGGNDGE